MYGEEILLTHHNQQDDGFFEIPHASLKISHSIGRGAFGSVYLAQAENVGGIEGNQLVAVKKLKSMRFTIKLFSVICLVKQFYREFFSQKIPPLTKWKSFLVK